MQPSVAEETSLKTIKNRIIQTFDPQNIFENVKKNLAFLMQYNFAYWHFFSFSGNNKTGKKLVSFPPVYFHPSKYMGCHLAGPVWSCWSAKNTLILLWHRHKLRMLVRVQRASVVESSDASIVQGTTHYGEKDKHDSTEARSNTSFPGFSYIKALI